MSNNKKCPYRVKTTTEDLDYGKRESYQDFYDCIGEQCQAYDNGECKRFCNKKETDAATIIAELYEKGRKKEDEQS